MEETVVVRDATGNARSNTSHDVLVDVDAEGMGDLKTSRYSGILPMGINAINALALLVLAEI